MFLAISPLVTDIGQDVILHIQSATVSGCSFPNPPMETALSVDWPDGWHWSRGEGDMAGLG